MAMLGMNIEQVRSLAKQLDKGAGDIESLLQTLTSALGSVEWVGNDATKFRSDWQGQHTAALRNVATALREAAQRANANAAEQEQASNN